MPVKLSITSKLDGIKSWSLQALETCPGSRTKSGELVAACAGCYATEGNYAFSSTIRVRAFNREDWKRAAWVRDMVAALDNERYFRWFDSGDVYDLRLTRKILAVMRGTPWVQHWLPTRSYKFPKFAGVFADMQELPNVSVRFSSDYVDGAFTPGLHGSTIITAKDKAPQGVKVCEAYENGGKCSGCRACWDKTTPVIAYVAHGQRMRKVIRLQAVATA